MEVRGPLSEVRVLASGMTVGRDGTGSLLIEDDGRVVSVKGRVAGASNSHGEVHIDNGTWEVSTVMAFGGNWGSAVDGGEANISLSNGGAIAVGQRLELHTGVTLSLDENSLLTVGAVDEVNAVLGAVTVGEGGLLMGSGNLGVDVILEGGSVTPGYSAGVLHVAGDFIAHDGEIVIEIFSDGTADQLIIDGVASFGDDVISLYFVDGVIPEQADIDLVLGQIDEPFSVLVYGVDPAEVSVSVTREGLSLAVPEPTTLSLLGIAALLAICSTRRKRR